MKYPRLAALTAGAAALALVCGLALTAAAPTANAGARTTRSVEQRLQELEDYQGIQKLLARYMTVMDASDWKGYSEIFATNGQLIFQSNHWTSRQAIYDGMSRPPAPRPAGTPATPPRQLRHTLTNIDLKIESPTRATGTARWFTWSQAPDNRPFAGATGHYDDIYVKENGEWKVLFRIIYTDFPFDDPPANLQKAGRPAPVRP